MAQRVALSGSEPLERLRAARAGFFCPKMEIYMFLAFSPYPSFPEAGLKGQCPRRPLAGPSDPSMYPVLLISFCSFCSDSYGSDRFKMMFWNSINFYECQPSTVRRSLVPLLAATIHPPSSFASIPLATDDSVTQDKKDGSNMDPNAKEEDVEMKSDLLTPINLIQLQDSQSTDVEMTTVLPTLTSSSSLIPMPSSASLN
jgi:hypothetical protein